MTYAAGHIKRDPDTGAVAIRTTFPDDGRTFSSMAWWVATINRGATHERTDTIEHWTDLYVPETTT